MAIIIRTDAGTVTPLMTYSWAPPLSIDAGLSPLYILASSSVYEKIKLSQSINQLGVGGYTTYHDGEFIDFHVVQLQALVSFGVVLVNKCFGGEEGLFPGFNVWELTAISGLYAENWTSQHAKCRSCRKLHAYLEGGPVLVSRKRRSLDKQGGRQDGQEAQSYFHGDVCSLVGLYCSRSIRSNLYYFSAYINLN